MFQNQNILECLFLDKWLNSQEALEYGLIDDIIGLNKSEGINELMEGFDSYYDKYVLGRK